MQRSNIPLTSKQQKRKVYADFKVDGRASVRKSAVFPLAKVFFLFVEKSFRQSVKVHLKTE